MFEAVFIAVLMVSTAGLAWAIADYSHQPLVF